MDSRLNSENQAICISRGRQHLAQCRPETGARLSAREPFVVGIM